MVNRDAVAGDAEPAHGHQGCGCDCDGRSGDPADTVSLDQQRRCERSSRDGGGGREEEQRRLPEVEGGLPYHVLAEAEGQGEKAGNSYQFIGHAAAIARA